MTTVLKVSVVLGAVLLMLGVLGLSQDSWIYAHLAGSMGAAALGVLFLGATLVTPRRRP